MDDLNELEQLRANRFLARRLNQEITETAQEVRATIALSRETIAHQQRVIKSLSFKLGVACALLVVALLLIVALLIR